MAALSSLLEQALPLDRPARSRWLEALAPEYRDLAEILREALIPTQIQDPALDKLATLPKVQSNNEDSLSGEGGLKPGERLGPYELIRPLGAGGMAEVWLARRADGAFKRDVALKLPLLLRARKDLEPRFAREREILASLTHPNIARLYDAGFTQHGQPYLALEFVAGMPLTTYCDDRRLTLRERLVLFGQVLSAVQYAHANLVIHRDLKPSNILVTGDGQVQLLDFGIAKLLSDGEAKETELTQLGGRALTPDYAAPEQIVGAPITTAADVYALGVVLYEILTGERPYRLKRDSRIALEEAILQADATTPSRTSPSESAAQLRATSPKKLARALKGELDTILLKALKKSPGERYATANAFGEDIGRFLSGDVVLAQPDTLAYRTIKFVGRHKVVAGFIAIVTALGIVASGAGLVAVRQTREAKNQAAQSLQAQSRLLTQAAAQRLKDGNVAGAQGIILEVLTNPAFARLHTPDAISVFQDVRSADAQLAVLAGHRDPLYTAAYSPDGTRIVTGSVDKTARIWDVRTGIELAVLANGATVTSANYSPDGTRIVTTSTTDKSARIWDARTGIQLVVLTGHGNSLFNAAYSPDGAHIVTASADLTARIWDATTGVQVTTLAGHSDRVQSAAYAPDGVHIVTASFDKTARIWDARTGAQLSVLSGHGGLLLLAAYSPDGTRIVTASLDKTARIWDAHTGAQLAVLSGHGNIVTWAAYSPDGNEIVTASKDQTARVWDAHTYAQLATLSGHGDSLQCAAYSPDGRFIVTASSDRTARIWDVRPRAQRGVLVGHDGAVTSAAYSPDMTHIATVSYDKTGRIWDARTGAQLAILSGHKAPIFRVRYSPDGTRLLTASNDKTVRVWNALTGAPLTVLSGHSTLLSGHAPSADGTVADAQFSPDGSHILTASWDKTARIWDAQTEAPLAMLSGHRDAVNSAAYSPDGTHIVTASQDKTARVWDALSGAQLSELSGHSEAVNCAAYSPDGAHIVTASQDHTARLWDAHSGALLTILAGHGGAINWVSYSPDGSLIVTASDDKTARIWDASTGAQLAVLSGHGDSVNSAVYAADGRLIVTASDDQTTRVWDARIPADLPTQILWNSSAEADPLRDTDRIQLGLPPDSRTRSWSGKRSACDETTAAAYDPDRVAGGATRENMSVEIALAACTADISKPAHSARSDYQMGRALLAKGDTPAARRQFELAASTGYRAARIDLADLQLDASAGTLDPGRAKSLYEAAWQDGVHIAGFKLGQLYELGVQVGDTPTGTGFQPNASKAWYWYQQAADTGEPNALARFGERDEKNALAEYDARRRNAILLRAFGYYAAAAERAHNENWPDDAWKNWRYRRASLARVLARDGLMQQVADAYQTVRDKWTPHPPTLSEQLEAKFHRGL
jgi:WD40 repeat protein